MKARLLLVVGVAILLGLGAGVAAGAAEPEAQPAQPGDPIVLAHYYIWFDPTSWNRAKTDFPALGRYSSDEAGIMRQHVEMAKSVGIDGFIVSWKSTADLDARLETLIAVCEELDFKLAVTYQGLDFNREPLAVERIESDLDFFVDEFSHSSAFDLFAKPLVVITGTWELTQGQLQQITTTRRSDLLILASEKNVAGYQRVADYVDGDLYYWSSVNPETNPSHAEKLAAMGAAVRENGGIWIAPAAPGFDARAVGGTTVVGRNDGDTLRAEWQVALDSLPNAIGIISWNEFSENTHIEPSVNFSNEALATLAALTGSPAPSAIDFDSSAPEGPPEQSVNRYLAIGFMAAVIIGSLYVIIRRGKHDSGVIDAEEERLEPERGGSVQ